VCGGSLAKWETSNGCEDRVIFVADMSQHLPSLTKQDSDVRVVHVDPTTADPRIEVEAMSSGLRSVAAVFGGSNGVC